MPSNKRNYTSVIRGGPGFVYMDFETVMDKYAAKSLTKMVEAKRQQQRGSRNLRSSADLFTICWGETSPAAEETVRVEVPPLSEDERRIFECHQRNETLHAMLTRRWR